VGGRLVTDERGEALLEICGNLHAMTKGPTFESASGREN